MNEPQTIKEVRRLLWQAKLLIGDLMEKGDGMSPNSKAYEEWDAILGSVADTDQLVLDMESRVWSAS